MDKFGEEQLLFLRIDLVTLDRPEDLAVAEIEVVEPSLFFDAKPASAEVMANRLLSLLK